MAIFRERLRWLDSRDTASANPPRLTGVPFHLSEPGPQAFQVESGAKLFTDADATITQLIPQLNGLTGIRLSREKTNEETLHITLDQPAEILVGFYKTSSRKHPPADPKPGDWRLQAVNGVEANGNPSLAVWSKDLPAGKNELDLGKGAYVILGFVPSNTQLATRIGLFAEPQNGHPPDLDWLFEN